MTPTMQCTDSSSLHCSTHIPAAIASSRSRFSRRRPAGPCCRCCALAKRPSGEEIERILRHVIGRIHRNWPAVEIMMRGDSHFATPEVMDLLEQKRCGYIFGLSTNMRLTEIGRPWSEDVATRRALSKS